MGINNDPFAVQKSNTSPKRTAFLTKEDKKVLTLIRAVYTTILLLPLLVAPTTNEPAVDED